MCWQRGAEGQDSAEQWWTCVPGHTVLCCLQDAHSVAQWPRVTAGDMGFSLIQCVFNEFYNHAQVFPL